jgi:membrane protease YdiL (CAAX protease family)
MSQNSSNATGEIDAPIKTKRKWWMAIVIPAWVLVAFIAAQVVVVLVTQGLSKLGVPFGGLNQTILNTIFAITIYALTLLIVIGLPWKILKSRTTKQDVGLENLPTWTDLLLAPAGFLVYIIFSALLTAGAMALLPWFDANQAQDTGFDRLNVQYEYILAFFSLVILAPVAEEVLFRGYLFGKLKKFVPIWAAILLTSLLFAVVHFSWNVGVDVFALSIILCLLRQLSGSLWPSILLHMLKNGVAFYLLFINPLLLNTLGG